MTIDAKVLADSISPQGIRLTTLQCRYPKFIHGEAKTHRMVRVSDRTYELLEEVGLMDDRNLSRNASSSRAIPVARLIQDVMDDPAMPVSWGRNQRGMQASEELVGEERDAAMEGWLKARNEAVYHARCLIQMDVHKQIVNRVIEPWCHIKVVVTATEWSNFFALRRHPDAQPEMRALADAMWDVMQASVPTPLESGQWHMPYVTPSDRAEFGHLGDAEANDVLRSLSVARCARVSYLTHDGRTPNTSEDLALYARLIAAEPLHASPAEHQATPDGTVEGIGVDLPGWQHPEAHGNLVGWRQYRRMLPGGRVP